jgi:hypothetical protein
MKANIERHPSGEYVLTLIPQDEDDRAVNAKIFRELDGKGLIGSASSEGGRPCQIILHPKKEA